jgi:hypothetical protein
MYLQLVAKKENGNCQNKINTFLQFFVCENFLREGLEMLELWSNFNENLKNYLISTVKQTINNKWAKPNLH